MKCILCASPDVEKFWEKVEKKWGKKVYHSCDVCGLVFLDPEDRVTPDIEKGIYLQHENSIENEGYVSFLKQLIDPLCERIPPGSSGLDFGSGPGPTLDALMEERGYSMERYDPFFHPDKSLLESRYDFITSTETAEHFSSPREEFRLLDQLLKEKGVLGIMTRVLTEEIDFPVWWYHRDPTHIAFYRRKTMVWIADFMEARLEEPRENVFFFVKEKGQGTEFGKQA